MKKTKKEKMLADLRKKIILAENKFSYSAQAVNLEQKPLEEKKALIFSKTNSSPALLINYSQIAKDLRKTLILSVSIVAVLLFLKFFLKA